MITLTIVEHKRSKSGVSSITREIKCFKHLDEARKIIKPIVQEMNKAKRENRQAKIFIDSVSYDDNAEKNFLLQLKAITSIENEGDEHGY